MPLNFAERALCDTALREQTWRVPRTWHQRFQLERVPMRRCLISARVIIRATIEKLGSPTGRQRGDKSDDIIDIVTFGQRGRKPRHLGPVEIVGVGAANPVKVALV